jgi:pimeloyl-ACP methyl ester carboxylesterase
VLALAAWRPIVQAGTLLTKALGRLGVHGTTDLEELGRSYALLADGPSRKAFIHTLRSVVDIEGQRVSAVDRIDAATQTPSLIVWGEKDSIVPVKHGRRVQQLVPHTYLAVFERAGHFPHRDDPARFVRVINEFLAREAAEDQLKRAAVGA